MADLNTYEVKASYSHFIGRWRVETSYGLTREMYTKSESPRDPKIVAFTKQVNELFEASYTPEELVGLLRRGPLVATIDPKVIFRA